MCPKKSKVKHQTENSREENKARPSTAAHLVVLPGRDSKTDSSQNHLPEREIDFAELGGGSLAEMVEDPANPAKSKLAVYTNGTVQYVDKWQDANSVLVPLARIDLLSKHVCLPQGAEPYGELKALLSDVASFFNSCLDIQADAQLLMTAFVFSTWFPEKLPFAPYLALVGPPGSGKTTALRILSLLCRRSLPTTDISSAAFYEVCQRMHPTLLIDETCTAGHQRTLLHLLRSSNSRGFFSLRKGKAEMAYGPKVLTWLELPNDAALNSRCIIIPMHKTARADLKSLDDSNVLQFAAKVRMRLLQFRFEHYHTLSPPTIPAALRLSGRTLDLYRALALPLGTDQESCEHLARLIESQRQFQPRLLSPPQASALRALYMTIHEIPKMPALAIKDLTRLINADLAWRGESANLSERKTGDILTSLGLTKRTRTNPGRYVLWLHQSDRVRIHDKTRDYEVDDIPVTPMPHWNCEICVKNSNSGASVPKRTPEAVNQKQGR